MSRTSAPKRRSIFLILHHPLTNFEIQKYYQELRKFNGVYLRDNSRKIKVLAYVLNFHEYESADSQLIALYVNCNKLKRSYTKKIS